MKSPVKNLLVYADGRVEEIQQRIMGRYFIVPELRDDGFYERRFDVHAAYEKDPKDPERLIVYTMVALECECVRKQTREEYEREREERRAETMRRVLDSIFWSEERDG